MYLHNTTMIRNRNFDTQKEAASFSLHRELYGILLYLIKIHSPFKILLTPGHPGHGQNVLYSWLDFGLFGNQNAEEIANNTDGVGRAKRQYVTCIVPSCVVLYFLLFA